MTRLVCVVLLVACGGSEPSEASESTNGGEQSPRHQEALGVVENDPHGEAVVQRLEEISDFALDEWEREVLSIMVGTYDFDASGSIDTSEEVHRIVCEVWRTLDRELRQRSSETSLREAYGFAPGQVWQGALGIDVSQREHLRQDLLDCGVR